MGKNPGLVLTLFVLLGINFSEMLQQVIENSPVSMMAGLILSVPGKNPDTEVKQ